jgi:hypothetical protein
MSDATYIRGTIEYVVLEIEATTPGFTFTPAEWTAKMALVKLGAEFNDAKRGIWHDAVLEAVGAKNYAKVLLGDELTPAVGKYRVLVRLAKTSGGTEIPLLEALGQVVVHS